MLHEILLSLSGVPSPIWNDLRNGSPIRHDQEISLGSLASPAEKAMVEVLAELADLHIKVRDSTTVISASHPSPICRAISHRIKSFHLRAFIDKVIHVETSILDHDAAYVGAYNIVPLSTIVSEFQPWARPLRWLWKTVQSLGTDGVKLSSYISGADALRNLLSGTSTGYTDLKDISEDLLVVAQRAWIQNLMPWVLYGKTPSFGADDFMIKTGKQNAECRLQKHLTPYFITPNTADTILSIGTALQQITPKAELGRRAPGVTSTCSSLMPNSLQHINSLQYPLKATDITNVIRLINDTISQAALSVILPEKDIYELLLVLQEYVLLRNGEFSSCLIQQADKQLARHQVGSDSSKAVRKLGRLDDLNMNEAETASVLEKTWSELSAFIPEKDSENELRDRAADLLRLLKSPPSTPVCTLLPNASSLVLKLSPHSPLNIFINAAGIERYQIMGAYLISIRRAEFQLTKLWREPSHRRCHPTPTGPPRSATRHGQQGLTIRRRREDRRNVSLRKHWACISQVLYLVSELGNYFQGEVIQKSWDHLYSWIDIDTADSHNRSRPTTASSKLSSRPPTSSSSFISNKHHRTSLQHSRNGPNNRKRNDPRTISSAHRKYISTLYHHLLLTNATYTSLLSTLLVATDHYVALFYRLQTIWTSLDLQEDSPSSSSTDAAFSNYAQEEVEVLSEMNRTNESTIKVIHDLIGVIRDIEEQRDVASLSSGVASFRMVGTTTEDGVGDGEVADGSAFEPWRARTLDRLLMKLDSLVGDERSDLFEDALVDLEDE